MGSTCSCLGPKAGDDHELASMSMNNLKIHQVVRIQSMVRSYLAKKRVQKIKSSKHKQMANFENQASGNEGQQILLEDDGAYNNNLVEVSLFY
jgi:hypothetical protein